MLHLIYPLENLGLAPKWMVDKEHWLIVTFASGAENVKSR